MPRFDAQVVRLYDTVFDRAPDDAGRAFWNTSLDNGYSLTVLADEFMRAPEFAATYGTPGNRQFVESVYLNVLDRPGDEAGIAFWAAALDEGRAQRAETVIGFSESPEHIVQMARIGGGSAPSTETPATQPPVTEQTPATQPPDTAPPDPGSGTGADTTSRSPVFLYGGDGSDAFRGAAGSDTLVGGLGSDALSGEAGDDFLWGGRDTGLGEFAWYGTPNDVRDELYGGDGNDRLHGDGGDDRLDGGNGDDTLEGFWGSDVLWGGDGNDVLRGDDFSGQSPRLSINAPDFLYGGAGNDDLHGGGGDDTLNGGDGDDVIDGWSGADALTGGAGADRFLFGSGISGAFYLASGRDTITDFGQGDVLDLARVMPGEAFTFIGQEPFSGSGRPEVRFTATTQGVLVQVDAPPGYSGSGPPPYGPPPGQADLEIVLSGVSTVNAADFIL